jgi:hypothetical protein
MPLCLPARIAGEQAARYFSRPGIGNLYGLLLRRVHIAPASRILPFVERLWLPAYAVRLHTASRETQMSVWTTVEGISGEFTMLECAGDLVDQELAEDCFPSSIDEEHAVELARKGMLRYVMAQRGQLNKPTVDAVEEVRPYHFAVWVYYYRRRRKFIDLKVLDAYTGKSAGAKMRVSVVNALVAAKRQREPEGIS